MRIGIVWPDANLLMFCRTDFKLVFKVLSLSTKMQFSTDLARMSSQPRITVDNETQMITEVDLDIHRGLHWKA